MSYIMNHRWTKRIAAGCVGLLGAVALFLPVTPAHARVSVGIAVPGVAVAVGAPYAYYHPPYYAYPYAYPYYAYPSYGGVFFSFGGGHHWHGHHHYR